MPDIVYRVRFADGLYWNAGEGKVSLDRATVYSQRVLAQYIAKSVGLLGKASVVEAKVGWLQ